MRDDKTFESGFVRPDEGPAPSAPVWLTETDGRRVPPRIPDHELLRVVGRGSYGEVWLARNVMGTYRAVKIIHRDAFEHQRPYEREFEGIKRYEPVSRTHESHVAVLHVGRHERDLYYYYVMELADDAKRSARSEVRSPKEDRKLKPEGRAVGGRVRTSNFKPPSDFGLRTSDCYSPRTLAADLQQRGRLPLDECIEVGLSLARGLEQLHSHGLIHRDIKPSNVIFVSGVPKLADIGLVAEKDSTMTFVGTRGYFPPEGPGTAAGDLYSLGKVLYEISTGRDRNEFPALPDGFADVREEARWLEFNEILLRACHCDARQRYASAGEMIEELSLLRRGRSVKAKRRREWLWVTARRAAVLAAVVLLIGVSGYRVARQPVSEGPAVPRPLRVVDVELEGGTGLRLFDISADGERIVFAGKEGLSLWTLQTGMKRPLALGGFGTYQAPRSAGWQVPLLFGLPRWAPDGQHFMFQAVKKLGGRPAGAVRVWSFFLVNAATGDLRQVGADRTDAEKAEDLCWLPDGRAITYVDSARRLYTLSLTGGRSLWVDAHVPGQRRVRLGGYSADGSWLLLSADSQSMDLTEDRNTWLMSHLGGRALPVTGRAGFNGHATWGPDGETVYFVSNDGQRQGSTWGICRVRLDLKTGSPRGPIEDVLQKNGVKVCFPRFVADGRRLVYAVVQPETRIWVADADQGSEPVHVAWGREPALSPDGNTIYFVGETPEQQGVYAIHRSGEGASLRKVTDLVPLGDGLTRGGISLSPDGGWIGLFGFDNVSQRFGVFAVPTASAGAPRRLQELGEWAAIRPAWSPDGQWLAYAIEEALYRISLDGAVRERLATLYRWQGWTLRWSPDGKHIAALAYGSPEEWEEATGVFVVNVEARTWRKLSPDTESQYKEGLEWHPSGEYLTYLLYGPEQFSAQIRRAYLDGRPTDLMIDQADHWDYVGVWSPDGQQFCFESSGSTCRASGKSNPHLFDPATGRITHHLGLGFPPVWSRDGGTIAWASGKEWHYFEVLEGFP